MLSRLIVVLALLWATGAQASVIVGPRYDWHYGAGYFHVLGGPQTAWSETIDGVEAYSFVQTARNDAYIELYDSSRALYVRLYADAMYLKGASDAAFLKFRDGHWDDRRMYSYNPGAGAVAYFTLGPSEVWRWVRSNMANVYLRETLRNDDQVQLYNAREGYTLSLMDRELWIKHDGGNWAKFTDAMWN